VLRKRRIAIIISIILFVWFLLFFQESILKILSILATSSVVAYLIFPLIKRLEKRVPDNFAIILSFIIIISIILSLVFLLVPIFKEQIQNLVIILPEYINNISDELSKIPYVKNILPTTDYIKQNFLNADTIMSVFAPQKIISLISSLLLIPVVVFYILKERENLKKLSLFLLPGKIKTPAIFIFRDINRQLRDYVFGEFVIILAVSFFMSIVLLIFGFDYWLILGILMGIFNIIPYVGPLIGSLPILLTAFYQDKVILAVVLILLVQQIDNLIIHPRIISDSVKIHPVIVLLCVVAGNTIGSVFGMVLAIPFFIIARILFREFYKYFSERKRNFCQINKI